LLEEGDILSIGSTINLKVIHTPGHTPGGICLDSGEHLFTGDTLFAGSIGRTDFPGGSYQALIEGVETKLFTLPGDRKVWPGHGPETTLSYERQHNPFFR
jgi:hydroxyacylglutathione hydrolase